VTMGKALDAWKKRSERDVKLPSGTMVTIRQTTVADQIVAGSFSAAVIPLARKYESNTVESDKDLSDDELRTYKEFRNTLIALSIKAVAGEPVELKSEDVAELPQDDIDELWGYALRLRPLPEATA
jgi:hypothetical protein